MEREHHCLWRPHDRYRQYDDHQWRPRSRCERMGQSNYAGYSQHQLCVFRMDRVDQYSQSRNPAILHQWFAFGQPRQRELHYLQLEPVLHHLELRKQTTATISLVNQNTIREGNDFAVDDISFAPTVMQTDSVTIDVESPAVAVTPTLATVCPVFHCSCKPQGRQLTAGHRL